MNKETLNAIEHGRVQDLSEFIITHPKVDCDKEIEGALRELGKEWRKIVEKVVNETIQQKDQEMNKKNKKILKRIVADKQLKEWFNALKETK